MEKKLYKWTANLMFSLHILFGLFVLVGWQFPDVRLTYLLAMSAWIGSWIFLGYCPLSYWEFSLRRKYDKSIDPRREIIKYYLEKFLGLNLKHKQ